MRVIVISVVAAGLLAGSIALLPLVTGETVQQTQQERISVQNQQTAAFSIADFTAPGQANVGQRVTATATVRNTGDAAGTTTIQYRIGGQVVATTTVTVDAGATTSVTLQGTVPTLAAGTYQQGMFVGDTDQGQTSQLTVGNPSATFAVLSLQAPSEARSGDTLRATATVKNTGDATGTRTFQYRVGDRVVASKEQTLSPGQTATISFKGSLPNLAAGTYLQGVFEGTTNNGLTQQLTITSPRASFQLTSLTAPSRAETGDTAAATVIVQNTGDARGSTTLQYRIDGTTVATQEITLDAGARQRYTLSGTVPERPDGRYLQGVFLGTTTQGLTTTIAITQRPSAYFRVSNLDAPPEAARNSQITVKARVTNAGSRAATVPIEYRIRDRTLAELNVSLNAGQSNTITFSVQVPELSPGAYTQGVFVADSTRGQTSTIRVTKGPKFTVTELSGPDFTRVGSRISVQAAVRNDGDTRGTGTVEYRIGDRVVTRSEVSLNAGERQTITLEGTVPSVTPGNYRQGVFVNDVGTTRSLTVGPKPEPRAVFGVSAFEAPSDGIAGDRISIGATVQNTGDASGVVTVEYRVDNRVLASRQVTLGAGQSRDVSFEATIPTLAPKPYQHGVFISGTTQGKSATLRIERGTPRFEVANLQAPARAQVDDEVSVRATITNTGTAAGETEVQYRLGETVVGSQTVSLAVGQAKTVTFDAAVPDVAAGTYQHGVFVGETSTGQARAIAVSVGQPRFEVANLRGPAEARVGDQITIQATITNTGTADGETEVLYQLGGETYASQTVTVPQGESTEVSLDVTVPEVDARTYRHGLFVGDTTRGQTTSLVVRARTTPTPREVTKTVIKTRTIIKTPTEQESPGVPGFGIPVAVVALLILAVLARRDEQG